MSLTCRPYCQAEGKIIPGCWQAYQMKERAWLWGLGMARERLKGWLTHQDPALRRGQNCWQNKNQKGLRWRNRPVTNSLTLLISDQSHISQDTVFVRNIWNLSPLASLPTTAWLPVREMQWIQHWCSFIGPKASHCATHSIPKSPTLQKYPVYWSMVDLNSDLLTPKLSPVLHISE